MKKAIPLNKQSRRSIVHGISRNDISSTAIPSEDRVFRFTEGAVAKGPSVRVCKNTYKKDDVQGKGVPLLVYTLPSFEGPIIAESLKVDSGLE